MARPPGIKKVYPISAPTPGIGDDASRHRANFMLPRYEYTTSLWIDGRWFPDFEQLGEEGWEGWAVIGGIAHFKRIKG